MIISCILNGHEVKGLVIKDVMEFKIAFAFKYFKSIQINLWSSDVIRRVFSAEVQCQSLLDAKEAERVFIVSLRQVPVEKE